MTITVLLHRQKPSEPQTGTIRAFTLVNGRPQGKNLLGGKYIKSMENAEEEVVGELKAQVGNTSFVKVLNVEFQIED